MATTFTSNYQIKLIGTGLEAGTWGTSTNENLKRVEQALGGSKFAFDVTSPGGASSWITGGSPDKILEWITSDASDAGAAGSEGRNAFVEFTGSPGGAFTVEIRGGDDAEIPDRVIMLRNSTGHTASLDVGTGTDYDLLNGCTAFIYTNTTTGSNTVGNLLGTLQLDGLNFPSAADVNIKAETTSALEVTDSVRSYVDIKTDNTLGDSITTLRGGTINLGIADAKATTVNLVAPTIVTGNGDAASVIQSSGNNDIKIQTGNGTTGYINIEDGSGGEISLRDANGQVVIGNGSVTGKLSSSGANNLLLQTNKGTDSGTIEITDGTNQPITLTPDGTGSVVITKVDIADGEIDGTVIGANSAAAITGSTVTSGNGATGVFSSNGNYDVQLKTGNSTTGNITITDGSNGNIALTPEGDGAVTVATDLAILTADGYLNFNSTVGSGGIGVRNNSGSVEVKLTSSDAWGIPYHSENVSGQGVYYESPEQAISASSVGAVTHGFNPAIPRLFTAVLRCKTADRSYSVGDEVLIGSLTAGATADPGLNLFVDDTNIGWRIGSKIQLFDVSTPSLANITMGSWRLVIRAWK